MSFFNPFRKNAQNRDARQEPGTREERPAVDSSGRLEPSFENTNLAKTMKTSDQPTAESRTDGVPPPWGEAPKAMPGETPKTPATVRLNENGIPPAFEEVKPARATFDPYGIAAQAQAEARAARESGREAAEEKVEGLVDRSSQAPEQGVSETGRSPVANAEGLSQQTADLSSGLGQEPDFASSRAASVQTQPQDNLQAVSEANASSKEETLDGAAGVSGATGPTPGDAMTASISKPRKAREKVSAAAELEADEEPATVISEPKAAPKKVHKLQMVRELSEEEIIARRRTKHRLVGAAALLLAVVVAAPFVLDSESSFETASIDTTIPSVSDNSTTLEVPPVPVDDALESKLEALEGAGEATEETGAEANAKADSKAAPKAEVKPAEKGADNTSAKTSDKTQKVAQADQKTDKADKADKTDKTEKAAQKSQTAPSVGITPPEGKGFYVQVMATSSELEAERTVKKLALLGLPAYRMPVERKATTLWRVRVGLYKTRKEAEGVVGTIVLNGIVSKPLVGAQ